MTEKATTGAKKATKATTSSAKTKKSLDKVDKKTSQGETLKISVKAFEHRVVDEAVKKIVSAAKDTGSETVGPIPLPHKDRKIHAQPIDIRQ